MSALFDAPPRTVVPTRPLMRNVGLVHLVAALVVAWALWAGGLQGCARAAQGVHDLGALPAGMLLIALLALSGGAMAARLPRMSALAPAFSLGTSLSMLAASAWATWWISKQPCMGNVLDRELVTVVLLAASAIAVGVTSVWLLQSRREFAPWHEARGVVVATATAVWILVCGTGYVAMLALDVESAARLLVTVLVPAATSVALTGWLRPTPAVAVVVPGLLQGGVLLLF